MPQRVEVSFRRQSELAGVSLEPMGHRFWAYGASCGLREDMSIGLPEWSQLAMDFIWHRNRSWHKPLHYKAGSISYSNCSSVEI